MEKRNNKLKKQKCLAWKKCQYVWVCVCLWVQCIGVCLFYIMSCHFTKKLLKIVKKIKILKFLQKLKNFRKKKSTKLWNTLNTQNYLGNALIWFDPH